jgi:hypothetical protein
LVLFGFKMLKSLVLYRRRVDATWRQSIAAGLAGLALSHTIARATYAGLASGRLAFFRTPKLANAPALLRALANAREETLLLLAFVLGAVAVLQRPDAFMLDVRVWAAVLIVQAVPYAASLTVAIVSALPRLSARLVGPLREMQAHGAPRPGPAPMAADAADTTMRQQTHRRIAAHSLHAARPGSPAQSAKRPAGRRRR